MSSPQFDPNLGRAGKVRPALEALEDRTCPSAIALQGHTLLINGDNNDNFITIRDQGNGTVSAAVVSDNGQHLSVTVKGVQAIRVNSGNGDDKIAYALTGTLTTPEQIALSLGQGDDQTSLDFSRGIKANLGVTFHTGGGDNQVDALFGAIANAKVNLATYLGDGFNQFNVQFNGSVTGKSAVSVYGNGGTGFSGLNFTESGTIAAGSSVAVNFQGGPVSDTFHENYTGLLDGQLTLGVNGGDAANAGDWIASNITLNRGSTGTLNAQFNGGAGDDMFLVNVHDYSGKLHALKVAVNGGGGQNQGVVTPKVVAVAHVSLS